MRKFLVLFLVFFFVGVKESNATERLVWTAGSAVNITLGPADAVHCRIKDNRGMTVFDDFGLCRIVLDRVTREHRGYWEMFVGTPGTVIVRSSWFHVNVEETVLDPTPVVTTSVERKQSSVVLKCSIPEDIQVQSCTFRDPSASLFIASPGMSQDGYGIAPTSYESVVEDNICKLTLVMPASERAGIWRCAVHTTRSTSYGFLAVPMSILDPQYPNYNTVSPVLTSKYDGISATEGGPLTMFCSTGAAVRYCYFRSPNGTVFNVGPATSSADHEYVGNGFEAGECGISFNNIWTSADGRWSCNVGLNNTSYFEEQTAFFNVYINERMMVFHRWQQENTVEIRLHITTGPKLEYCRFVRSDGLGFNSEQPSLPNAYDAYKGYGLCVLHIPRPVAEDLRPWTIVAKVSGEDEERSVTTTLAPRPHSTRGLSRTAAVLLWSFFGTIFVFLIVVSLLPKRNRQWTHQRVIRIRNSFRRQPQQSPPPQNVTVAPVVHTDILTDLPRKV